MLFCLLTLNIEKHGKASCVFMAQYKSLKRHLLYLHWPCSSYNALIDCIFWNKQSCTCYYSKEWKFFLKKRFEYECLAIISYNHQESRSYSPHETNDTYKYFRIIQRGVMTARRSQLI